MVLLMTEEAEEKRIVTEFCHLLEKSKQLFNGLRDLPPYGYKQWQTYFGRTFDIYTKLWKFQQQHRPTLDKIYCLKRWQIGEIASKIGQLYYHYYLRTSELHYLLESAAFYGAIRSRGYYSKSDEKHEYLVRKLRYLARFILVCLLLRRMKLVKELVHELSECIEDYSNTPMYEAEDHLEWTYILEEIISFLQAESPLTIVMNNTEQNILLALDASLHGGDGGDDDNDNDDNDGLVSPEKKGIAIATTASTSNNNNNGSILFVPTYRLVNSSNNSYFSSIISSPTTTATTTSTSTNASVAATAGGTGNGGGGGYNLQEILIVCTKSDQIKFSEYTIDMYRMLQTFERDVIGFRHNNNHHHNAVTNGSISNNNTSNALNNSSGAGAPIESGGGLDEEERDEDGQEEEQQLITEVDGLEENESDVVDTNHHQSVVINANNIDNGSLEQMGQSSNISTNNNIANNAAPEISGGQSQSQGQQQQQQADKINPHKYLLYKPTIEQLLVYISCSWKCLGHDGVLLLYISGDSVNPPTAPSASSTGTNCVVAGIDGSSSNGEPGLVCSTNPFRPRPIAITTTSATTIGTNTNNNRGYDCGGISTSTIPIFRKESQVSTTSTNMTSTTTEETSRSAAAINKMTTPSSSSKCQRKDKQCLYPGDLFPFTRKPLFLIIDSENSHIFNDLSTSQFTTPLLILMSPMELPSILNGTQSNGSLFTHFLHSPFSAFTSITQINTISKSKWNVGQEILNKFMAEASKIYMAEMLPENGIPIMSHHHHNHIMEFFTDEFLRVLMFRFVFCEIVLRMHKSFQNSTKCLPKSQPNLLNQIKSNASGFGCLQGFVLELARVLAVSEFFNAERSD